jgi:hypothetical protein
MAGNELLKMPAAPQGGIIGKGHPTSTKRINCFSHFLRVYKYCNVRYLI